MYTDLDVLWYFPERRMRDRADGYATIQREVDRDPRAEAEPNACEPRDTTPRERRDNLRDDSLDSLRRVPPYPCHDVKLLFAD